MKHLKRILLSFGIGVGALLSNVANAGIPVIDGANLANSIQQVIAWGQQYQQMVSQIQQTQQQYSSLTGIRGFGDIANNAALKNIIKNDLVTTYGSIKSSGYSGLSTDAKSIRDANVIYNCGDLSGDDKKQCEAALNINSQIIANQQNALTMSQQRTSQIESLQSQINTTQDPKAIAELQARLQVESVQVANDANKIATANALAESQRKAAEQAIIESQMKTLSANGTPVSSTFKYTPP
jgi:type IV secretion system protein VirB5